MENNEWQSPFSGNWDGSSDMVENGYDESPEDVETAIETIDDTESDEVRENNVQMRGRAVRTIAGKLRYPSMESRVYIPLHSFHETTREDYLGRDYYDNVLNNPDISDDVKSTYRDIVEKYPIFRTIEIKSSTEGVNSEGGFMFWRSTAEEGDEASPHMLVAGDFTDKYKEEFTESEYLANRIISDRLGVELGCDPNWIMNNGRLLKDIVLLHELGHANSFLSSYLYPFMKDVEKKVDEDDAGHKFSIAISEAGHEWMRRTDVVEDAKMITPGSIVSPDEIDGGLCDRRADAYRKNVIRRLSLRYDASEMGNAKAVRVEDARRYRQRNEEQNADKFAIDYVIAHKDKYFEGVQLDCPIDVTESFDVVLNYQTGSHVTIMEKGDSNSAFSGRLLHTPYKGGELVMTGSDDPDDENDLHNYGTIEEVECRNKYDEAGKKYLQITIKTDKGEYITSKPREVSRPIKRSVEAFVEAMGAKPGQELQLLSLYMPNTWKDLESDDDNHDDAVGGGGIVYGRITKEMAEGEPICLDTETIKRNVLHDWISWPVESVEQDWRTWRINTRQGDKVATYEVIPLPSEKHKKIDYDKIRA